MRPTSHAFGQDEPVLRSIHFFQRTGQDAASQCRYHPRGSRKPLCIESRLGTVGQTKTFSPPLTSVYTYLRILAQQTVHFNA